MGLADHGLCFFARSEQRACLDTTQETLPMGARTKLNAAYLNGALLFASMIGFGLQSWSAFIVTAGLLIAVQTVVGGIRPGA